MIYKEEKYYKVDTGGHGNCIKHGHHLKKLGFKYRVIRQSGFSYDYDLFANIDKKEFNNIINNINKDEQ